MIDDDIEKTAKFLDAATKLVFWIVAPVALSMILIQIWRVL